MSMWDSIKNRLKHELIDIVEFLDDSGDTLSYRFERFQNEIKNGAKVNEGTTIIRLPNLSRMRADVEVHEAKVDKICEAAQKIVNLGFQTASTYFEKRQ